MPQFCFRLRFHLRDGDSIGLDLEEAILFSMPNNVTIKIKSAAKDTPIKSHSRAALVGGPFESEDAARIAAFHARRALLAWAVSQRIGMDLGDDKLRSQFTRYGLGELSSQVGQPVRNDVHGLDVYESDGKTLFVSWNMDAKLTKAGDAFMRDLHHLLGNPPQMTDKQALSAELYALSFFESSFRARFLTLVAAIEALLEPAFRHEVVREFVSDAQGRAAQLPVDDATRQAVQSSLEWLKRESIGQAGRALADRLLRDSQYLGMNSRKFFAYCYNLRSQILHSGKPSNDSVDLLELANATQQFVGDLLNEALATPARMTG